MSLCKTRDKKSEIQSSTRKTLKICKLSHGDMIFLYLDNSSGARPKNEGKIVSG